MTTEERLRKLEQELSGLKVQLAECVTTRRLRIVNARGEVRACLRIIVDARDKLRACPGSDDSRVCLNLYDASGEGGVTLWVGSHVGATLWMHDQDGVIRAELAAGKCGTGLGLFDEQEKLRINMAMNEDGPNLCFWSEETGEVLARMTGGGCEANS